MKTPAEHLRDTRRAALAEVDGLEHDARDQLESVGAVMLAPMPLEPGGNWDAVRALEPWERRRLVDRWTSAHGSGPESLGDAHRPDDPAAGFDEWLRLTRIVDAARAVRAARRTGSQRLAEMASLGGSSVDDHLRTDHELARLFGPSAAAHEYLAERDDAAEDESWEVVAESALAEVTDDGEVIEHDAAPEPIDALTFYGLAEVADLTGASLQTVSSWRRRGQMPEPVAVLKCGAIWHAHTIAAWIERPTSVAGRRAARSAQSVRATA